MAAAPRGGVGMHAAVMVGRVRRSNEAKFADCRTTSCARAVLILSAFDHFGVCIFLDVKIDIFDHSISVYIH